MKIKYLNFIILSFVAACLLVLANQAFAQENAATANVQYPVKELGNCQDQAACKIYCDKPENINACVAFAEKNNLISEEKISAAKKFIAAGAEGPGGCKTKDACETYCNDISHIDACIVYAEKNNLMSTAELAEAKQIQAAIARGINPPPCKNKEACDTYCDSADHMEECITFSQAAGMLQGKELEDAQKMLAAVKKGATPPPCKGKDACDTYCSEPNNMEVCMNFAMEAGLMTEEEKADSQKMLTALKKGLKPPACKGEKECQAYCTQESHFDECTNFAEAAGFMTAEEAVMARKTGGKGPGDCVNKDECEAFCNNLDNQQTCFNFAKENGMIPEADLKQMEEGMKQFKESLDQAPQTVIDCLNSQFGTDMMEKFKSGAVMPPKEAGDQMRTCFEKGMSNQNQNGQNQQNQNQLNQQIQPWADMCSPDRNGNPTALACVDGSGKFVAPAKVGLDGEPVCPADSTAKCGDYQQNNQQGQPGNEFRPGPGTVNPGGQMMPEQSGPGGCKTPEECKAYCESHSNECGNSGPGEQQQFMPGTNPMSPGNGGTFAPGTSGQQPPAGQYIQTQMPPENQQPPADFVPPPTENTPPPSGFMNQESLSGSIINILIQSFQGLNQ